MLEKFAKELKAEREAKKVSLLQVAAKTRLDIKYLKEMEQGNFTFLPDLYVKAFIKDYAKVLDLNIDITLKKYEAAKKGKEYNEKGETEEELLLKKQETASSESKQEGKKHSFNAAYSSMENNESDESRRRNKSPKIIWIAGAAVVVLIIIYFAFIKSSNNIIVAEKPYDQVKQSSKERFIEEKPQTVKANSTQQSTLISDSLSLEIDATDTSWVKILIDDSVSEEFTLFPHSRKDIKAAKNYQLIVGNAAATHFSLNKKPLNFTGKNKEVRYISIDSAGLKYLSAPPNFGN